jgi:hypothetical protein
MQNQLAVRSITSIDDVVVFERNNNNDIGKIIEGHSNDRVSVVTFKPLTPELLLQHSLPAVTVDDSPFAVKSEMVEVFQTATIMEIRRSSIIDFAFILPLQDVESGLCHLTGALNTFFIRYMYLLDGSIQPYPFSMLQARVAEPLSFRIFRSLNLLSFSIKKVFYHQPEGQTANKSFRIPFAYDPFLFIWSILLLSLASAIIQIVHILLDCTP